MIIWIILIICALTGIFLVARSVYALYYKHPANYREATLEIKEHVFHLDLADTSAKRTQGLSGRALLKEDQGMLFLFPISSPYSFWMKDMKFPIDIVWISGEKVVGVSKDLPAPKEGASLFSLPQYSPPTSVDKVLEISAGLSAKYGIKEGDQVVFHLPKNEKARD